VRGLAVDLGEQAIGCVLLGDTVSIAAGSIVHGTGAVARVPVGEVLLGRVVDALGSPLDGGILVIAKTRAPVEQPAPAIVDRALVTRPLATGILVIDAMIRLAAVSANSSSATAAPAKPQSRLTRSSISVRAM
jgi:F-type H+/Na+-transporting ATPase subunit alpha